MDAVGLLNTIGSLGALIPNLTFLGVYGLSCSDVQRELSLPLWKFGIATVSYRGVWAAGYKGSDVIISTPPQTFLVSPGMIATPTGGNTKESYWMITHGTVSFLENKITCTTYSQFTSILFNY